VTRPLEMLASEWTCACRDQARRHRQARRQRALRRARRTERKAERRLIEAWRRGADLRARLESAEY
jgi:hypothetical protein